MRKRIFSIVILVTVIFNAFYISANAYESRCYCCHRRISSDFCYRCGYCGWYICTNCGACGCGYYGYIDYGGNYVEENTTTTEHEETTTTNEYIYTETDAIYESNQGPDNTTDKYPNVKGSSSGNGDVEPLYIALFIGLFAFVLFIISIVLSDLKATKKQINSAVTSDKADVKVYEKSIETSKPNIEVKDDINKPADIRTTQTAIQKTNKTKTNIKKPPNNSVKTKQSPEELINNLEIGKSVRHSSYGKGLVKDIDKRADRIVIDFGSQDRIFKLSVIAEKRFIELID
jgi:hypothetical protein